MNRFEVKKEIQTQLFPIFGKIKLIRSKVKDDTYYFYSGINQFVVQFWGVSLNSYSSFNKPLKFRVYMDLYPTDKSFYTPEIKGIDLICNTKENQISINITYFNRYGEYEYYYAKTDFLNWVKKD